ncbi:hypothetical protein GF343_03430 [Candidatus Woesearchaeota archaeon]|nr:hypothetical protein [Candidatus Woesearchaeota archaeon]
MAKKNKKSQKSENPLRTFQDLHSAVADLAAHYIPRSEIKEYFTPEELKGVQKKPSYSVTPDERGLVERVVFRLVEKKDKEDGTGEASASESILKAARACIPRILVEAEDLAGIDPSNINPHNVQPFLKNAAENIAMYLLNNEPRLRKYDETAFIDALNNIFTIGEHVETQVRHACKKKINMLEDEVLDAKAAKAEVQADKEKVAGQKEALARDVAKLEADKTAQAAEKSVIEAREAELETELTEAGHACRSVTLANDTLKQRVSGLEAGKAVFEEDKKNLQLDLAQTLEYKQAEMQELQERILANEHDQKLSAAEIKDLQEKLMYAEHEYMQEIDKLQGQLLEADENIVTLSEKSAGLEQERDKAKKDSAQMREEYDALFAQYSARFAELGDSVAEWYAFIESAFAQNAEFNDNEQLQELRSRGKKLAVLVSDLIEEAKSGSRVGQDRKKVNAPWHEPEEASLPTLEDEDDRYSQMLDEVKAEHQKEIWGWMHALKENNAPYELKQKVYAKFLATEPKDNLIRCVAHNNLGNIFYEHSQDYKSARVHYQKAVAAVEQELVQNPENKVAVTRLAQAKQNLDDCNKKLSAA